MYDYSVCAGVVILVYWNICFSSEGENAARCDDDEHTIAACGAEVEGRRE